MNTEMPVVMEETVTYVHHVSWSAIFAGALVGLGLGFLLKLYSVAIGLTFYSASTQGAPIIAIGGLLSMLIGIIISMMLTGFVTGYMGRSHCSYTGGVIYGFITWSLVLFLSALMMGPAHQYVKSYTSSFSQNSVANDDSPSISSTHNVPLASVPVKGLVWSGWVIFLVFFGSAISCCIGAVLGMNCKHKAAVRLNIE